MQGQVQWLAPVILTTWEADIWSKASLGKNMLPIALGMVASACHLNKPEA
jgi:hypothetical protein